MKLQYIKILRMKESFYLERKIVMYDKVFSKALKLIKEQGEDSSQNISDYWFVNRKTLSKILDKKWPVYSKTFDLLIRWHSDIGCECTKQINDFIKETQKKAILERSKRFKSTKDTNMILDKTIIDFNKFSFIYKNKRYTLNDFVNNFNISKITGLHDLRGINLSNIKIDNCCISNCFFENADFFNSCIQQTEFNNCIFTYANFDNARLSSIIYDDKTSFGNVSIKNTFLNVVDLKGFFKPKNIKVVSYFWVIKQFFKALFILETSNRSIMSNIKHTVFWLLDTRNNTEKENIEFISYVDWFQYITTKIYNIREENIINRVKFLGALISTKYWNSCKVLIFFSSIINTIYSFIYYLLRDSFNSINDFGDCIYFSIVTFTTLGFGDILPKTHSAQLLVVSEVIVGYTILGVFVFLLSKKISKLF